MPSKSAAAKKTSAVEIDPPEHPSVEDVAPDTEVAAPPVLTAVAGDTVPAAPIADAAPAEPTLDTVSTKPTVDAASAAPIADTAPVEPIVEAVPTAPADAPAAEADPETAAEAAPAAAAPVEEEEEEEDEVAPRRQMTHSHGMGRSGMGGGRVMPAPRAMAKAENFVEGDHVVYPTHGVGKVERIATEEIAGHRLELIHITFEENRMTLRVPVSKARTAGLRKLATRKMFDEAMAVLKGRARIKRTMWSRRAQEYEAKINSGDPLAIAEVVRDLHRNAGQPDQSFSERQIYEAAMDRLAAELAALDQIDKTAASVKLAEFLKTV